MFTYIYDSIKYFEGNIVSVRYYVFDDNFSLKIHNY